MFSINSLQNVSNLKDSRKSASNNCKRILIEHDYYKLMELEPGADIQAVKKRYRELAVLYHPDKNPDNRHAEEFFKILTQGYTLLSDAADKQVYDRLLTAYYRNKTLPFNKQKARDEEIKAKVQRHREKKRQEFMADYLRAEQVIPHRYRFVFALLLFVSGVLMCYNHWFINLLNFKLFYVIAGSLMFGTGSYLLAENVYRRKSFSKAERSEEYTNLHGPVRLFVKLFFITPAVFLLLTWCTKWVHLHYFYDYIPVKKVMFFQDEVEYLYEVNGEEILRRGPSGDGFREGDKRFYMVRFSRINPCISELTDMRRDQP